MQSARSERQIILDGKTVTLHTPAQKHCSTAEFTETIGDLVGRLEERYGVEIPLSDLFLFDTPAAPLGKFVHTFRVSFHCVEEKRLTRHNDGTTGAHRMSMVDRPPRMGPFAPLRPTVNCSPEKVDP